MLSWASAVSTAHIVFHEATNGSHGGKVTSTKRAPSSVNTSTAASSAARGEQPADVVVVPPSTQPASVFS